MRCQCGIITGRFIGASGIDLPNDKNFQELVERIVLDSVDLAPGEKAILSLQLPAECLIIFDPVIHMAQFLEVQDEPTRERHNISFVMDKEHARSGTMKLAPGPIRLTLENRTTARTLPSIWIAGEDLHALPGKRRPFLTAKRLLTNQTFRDIYRTDTLDVTQRVKSTSFTFLFTDLKGSTELYERVGDLVAYDLVQTHFHVLKQIVAAEAGAVVKTIGDAVMATFPTPDRAVAAAIRMREAMRDLNGELLLKIGIRRQDYFGQTVNIASRIQNLAGASAILASLQVVGNSEASRLLQTRGITPMPRQQMLRGVAKQITVIIRSTGKLSRHLNRHSSCTSTRDRVFFRVEVKGEFMPAAHGVELPQGTLDLLILQTPVLEPQHGWAISERLQQISSDVLRIQQDSLYPALHRLERRGWIRARWGTSENNRRAKYYGLTKSGLRQLELEKNNWIKLTAAMAQVLGTA
jgi:transcriptional regulator